MDDKKFMKLALDLAEKARGRTSPNPLVGAVIVKNGKVIGQGYHQKAGTPHAEVHALQQAGIDAKGAALYVTLEPCSHFGRTPPCSTAVIKAGINEVFVAMQDPNPQVSGRGIKQLEEAGIKVHIGLMQDEALKMNEIFVKYIKSRIPFVLLKTAMSLDGKIATKTGHARWITGESARHRVHELRNEYDAILVGVNTVLADDPALTCRLPEGGRDPIRVILDSRARIPLNSRVLTEDSDTPTYLVISDRAPFDKIKALSEQTKAKILRVDNDDKGRINLHALLKKLGQMEITSLLVEGGAEISASFIKERLVDKVITFIAPKLVGGRQSPTPLGGEGIDTMDEAVCLKNTRYGRIGGDFYIEGYPEYLV